MDTSDSSSLILPDSRCKDIKGVVRGKVSKFQTMNWVPVFCANCGIPHGYVPEENCTFACWLCDPCSEKWGTQYGLACMPDELFWKKVEQEQLDKYGRLLSKEEMQKIAECSCTPLSTLLREGN